MTSIVDFRLPELRAHNHQLIRIPPEQDVWVTPRVVAILDTANMQRLKRISQLGLVGHVYPGADHSRFEHSLGVYRLACLVLQHLLGSQPQFAARITDAELKVFLLSALLHDIGHWPYCHAIEDLQLPDLPRHEPLARKLICSEPIAQIIDRHWHVAPERVAEMISATGSDVPESSLLRSLLSGPVDVDKMDYLQRDSLHAGVPYGRNFDVGRLIASFCVSSDGRSLAISEKGKTAAEMMVFARYVMFSEVYWHHAVRSATAMLQRLVFNIRSQWNPEQWLTQTEPEFAAHLSQAAAIDEDTHRLSQGLFGHQRSLYKRVFETTLTDNPRVFEALARRPYSELVEISKRLAERLSRELSTSLRAVELLIDAPPVKLEVQFSIDVRSGAQSENPGGCVALSSISPVVRALATDQFDNFVKRIRVFLAPHRALELKIPRAKIVELLLESSA